MRSIFIVLSALLYSVWIPAISSENVPVDSSISEEYEYDSSEETDDVENLSESIEDDEIEQTTANQHPCIKYQSFVDSYEAIPSSCKGIHFGSNATLTSSGYPGSSPAVSKCLLIICGYKNQLVRLVWDSVNIDEGAYYDLRVYDKIVSKDNTADTWNRRTAFMYINKYSTAFAKTFNRPFVAIEFNTDATVYKQFKARFWILDKETDCQQEHFGDSGVIKSHNFPDNHISSIPCFWKIRSSHGTKIELNAIGFASSVPQCEHGYLEIRNGGVSKSAVIDRICGRMPNVNLFKSDSNVIRIEYFTAIQNKGFQLEWNARQRGCGGTQTQSSGVVESPDYYGPLNRTKNNVDCTWNIHVNEGSTIKLDFIDIFQLNTVSSKCGCSSIRILDGIEDDSKVLVKLCENEHYGSVYSSTNKVTIKFLVRGAELMGNCKDQMSLTRNVGFAIKYRADSTRVISGFGGVIESLDHPKKYPENLNITWILQASQGNSIDLNFLDFRLESGNDGKCHGDYVTITEWDRQDIRDNKFIVGKFCTNETNHLTPRSDTLAINFVTDYQNYEKGFRLAWKETGCSRTIDLIEQSIQNISTPRYPTKYPTSIICRWLLKTSSGNRLILSLDELEIEWEPNCKFDVLQIHDGPNELSPKVFEFCGKLGKSIVITSSGESFFLKLKSDATIAYKGFIGTVKQINNSKCDHEYRSNSGFIYLKSDSRQSDRPSYCTWDVFVAKYSRIQYEVSGDNALEETCNGTTFQVFDEDTTLFPKCGYLLKEGSKTFQTNENELTIKVAMEIEPIHYDPILFFKYREICESVITDHAGILTTPPIIPGTGQVVNCNWQIVASSPEKKILLLLTRIDWAIGEPSLMNHSVLISIPSNVSDRQTVYKDCCGPIPEPMFSLAGELTLNAVGGIQVQALFAQIPNECCMDYLSALDNLADLNNNTNNGCVPTIETERGSHISVIALNYDPKMHHKRCKGGFIEVYVGGFFGKLEKVYCRNDIAINPNIATHQYWTVYIRAKGQNIDDISAISYDTSDGGSLNQQGISFWLECKMILITYSISYALF